MRHITRLLTLTLLAALPGIAAAKNAGDILDTMREKQLERWQGVDMYVVEQKVMGQSTRTWYQRAEIETDGGGTQTVFLPMPDSQVRAGHCPGTMQMTPEDMEAYADGMEMVGAGMGKEIEDGLEAAGLPRGLLAASGSDPTATFDPRVMMGSNATFMRAAANAERERAAADPTAPAREDAGQMAQFMAKAKLVGTEQVEGRKAYHLQADNLDQVQQMDGREFHVNSVSLWVDTSKYVPLQTRVEGIMVSGSESRPMTLESIQSDYRDVPGSRMYEPYRQTMKISGMMDAGQEAQMEEAQAKMAEMEKQLASMPPEQRQMMENMMGPQLQQMRSMSAGGGFQTELSIASITVNPDLAAATGGSCRGGGTNTVASSAGPAAAPAVATVASASTAAAATKVHEPGNLTATVQKNLAALGYNPGNANGEMTTQTAVAISQFQAENNLPVTGEVSPQLAGILAAKVSGKSGGAATDPAALKAAQQACLERKMAEAEQARKTKSGLTSLFSGISKVASQFAGIDLSETTTDIYQANSSAEDFAKAAEDLGLTEDDVAECQNPQ